MPYKDLQSPAARASRKRRSRKYYETHREMLIEKSAGYTAANLTKIALRRAKHRVKKYGLTPEDVERMFVEQGGRCAVNSAHEISMVFGSPSIRHIDHDHKTGRVRGLVCGRCNVMLGMGNDDPETLRLGAEYLERHGQ